MPHKSEVAQVSMKMSIVTIKCIVSAHLLQVHAIAAVLQDFAEVLRNLQTLGNVAYVKLLAYIGLIFIVLFFSFVVCFCFHGSLWSD